MVRHTVSSGSPFEPRIGFSRAVRVGRHVAVAGTGPVGADDADLHGQTARCLEIVRAALEEAGATLGDVVRTRVMLTEVEGWEEAARAHADAFGAIRPASTFVRVAGLLDPRWRVEVEADAVLPEDGPPNAGLPPRT
jgi:enamine deaminase RidA (YjgF/YER057c/UK114 family)